MSGPFFSVIVVSFRAGEKLEETIRNILSQSCQDLEILVQDGGSDDGSYEKLCAYLSAYGSSDRERIRLRQEKDQGIYDGMNRALSGAAGQYIYFLNCGDRLHDEYVLERVKTYIEAGRSASEGVPRIYYGDICELRSGQHVAANPNMSHFAMFRYLPCHQACFYDRRLFETRGFDLRYRVRADYEHFLWCCIRGGGAAVSTGILIADYEGGGFSETPEGKKRSKEEHRKITKEYFSGWENFLFHAYLVLTLQPLREKLAGGKLTAEIYDGVKNRIYRH